MRSRGGLSADFVDFVCTWGEHAGEVVEAGGEVVQLWGEFVHVYGGWHGLGGNWGDGVGGRTSLWVMLKGRSIRHMRVGNDRRLIPTIVTILSTNSRGISTVPDASNSACHHWFISALKRNRPEQLNSSNP